MIRYVALLFALACGTEEAPPQIEDPVGDEAVGDEAVGDEDVVQAEEGTTASSKNTVGGKEIPTQAARTNDPVANGGGGGGGKASGGADRDRGRAPIVSVPVEGELPGIRGEYRETSQDVLAANSRDGDHPKVKDDEHDRRVLEDFADTEITDEDFDEMKELRKMGNGEKWKPDPDRYKDPRNYAQNKKEQE